VSARSGSAPAAAVPRLVMRVLERDERQLAYLWGVLAVSSLLLRPVWLAAAPLLPHCAFRAITGVPCLSCGTTRAAVALLNGHLVDALAANPLAALAGLGFLLGGLLAPVWAALGLPVPRLSRPPAGALRISLVLLLLAGWSWVILVKP